MILGRRKVGILHTIFIIQDLVLWIRKPWEKVLKFFCQVFPSTDYKQHKRHKVHNFAIRHQRKQFSFSSCQRWKKKFFSSFHKNRDLLTKEGRLTDIGNINRKCPPQFVKLVLSKQHSAEKCIWLSTTFQFFFSFLKCLFWVIN